MMNLTQIAFRFRPVVTMLTLSLMIYGAFSYFSLPAREDPQLTIRETVITTSYPGLSPQRMERLVTKTLEEAVRQVPEVEEIRSSSMAGVSIIHAQVYARYFELDQIWDDLREKVQADTAELPEGTSAPQINDDFGDVAVVTAALTADDFPMRDLFDMAKHVRDQLYAVAGTKRVDLHGVQDERIYIEMSNARLAQLGVSPDAITAALRDQNIIRPGGEIDTGERGFIIEPSGNYQSVEAIGETLIRVSESDLVPLRDMATITRGYLDPPRTKAYFNGRPAIIFAVAMLNDQSVLDYAPRIKSRLNEIERTLPVGYSIDLVTYQAEQVENAVYGVTANVLQTLAIVLGVVILFLGLRIGLIVGAIVPAVMLITLAIMGFAEMDLQRMSLATLVIALGLLVDNGIVIAEDFKRRLEEGEDRDTALKQTGGELAIPLLTSTLTTILVFLPLMLAQHQAGEYTRAISLVILITLSVSWLLALTVTPILCHRFIALPDPYKTGDSERRDITQRLFAGMNGGYEWLLRRVMHARGLFLAVMLATLAGSIFAIANAPARFFPNSDRTQVLVYIDLPAGVTTRTTDARLGEVFALLKDEERFPYIDDFAGYVGYGGPRFVLSLTPIDPAPNKGFLVLNIDEFDNMCKAIAELRTALGQEFPGLAARVSGMFLGPTDPGVIQVQARGPDAQVITQAAAELEAILAGVPNTIDIWNDWENRVSKLVVEIDQARARRAGVTSSDIADSMTRYFSGSAVSEFREGDDIVPIVARADDAERSSLDRVETLSIHSHQSENSVPLIQVADVRLRNDFARIEREDMTRTMTIEARNTRLSPEDMVPFVAPRLEALNERLPPGHSVEFDGVVTDSAEGQAALAANIPLCLMAIVVLLVAQFNSFKRPAIILLTVPLVVTGAAVGLYVMGADFGFMVILGLYSLGGIIINNAIVLIDRIDLERADPEPTAQGTDAFEAVISASVRRLRPILMTTVTTVLGLLPLIVSRDPLFFGMASVIAFGLLVGTIMTLGVVPVLYSLFFGITPQAFDASTDEISLLGE
ncbi:efflux RND transporter permease subunit [Halomonas sp. PR-M31]|uniref:efflux RND transporter permease subunit n=1 Tax=Halomonas sp. PR-M31 TaxID=1471202 RepID=UPI000AA380FB|nr:efflux RND transporter permease subunit [Halomonas sp. PR-M31]